ncbi:DUF4097 family beta strand repeat-containing protein [Halomicrobium zhouii]|uniref:DUF4097 family beta strand repeat-containing protein n=1 Tax=Halomicrobium zhouii TaxID=767519 RepID=UPI000B801771|nr:DUF4097 family beta strand repeat-containing protein [Halomicrobium zhouii]
MRRRRFLGVTAALAVTGTAGCVGVDASSRTETHEFDVSTGTDVVVSNTLGDLTVEEGDAESLRVRAEKHDGLGNDDAFDNVRVATEATDEQFEVSVVDERDDRFVKATWLHLRLSVPSGVAVTEVTGDDGDVTVDGAGGALTVDVEDGDVDVRDRDGDVTVTADDGDHTYRGLGGDLTVSGDDGDVTAERVGGDVAIDLDDGDADVSDVDGAVSVETGDGDVDARSVGALDAVTGDDGDVAVDVPAIRDDARIEVDDGDVIARLGSDLDARLVLETDGGDVDTSGLDERLGVEGDVERLATTLGEGTHTLRITTDDGDVELQSLD